MLRKSENRKMAGREETINRIAARIVASFGKKSYHNKAGKLLGCSGEKEKTEMQYDKSKQPKPRKRKKAKRVKRG
jgi:hypothetical protein